MEGADLEATRGVVTPARIAAAAFVASFACALWVGFGHPGLGYEADRVANWLYFQRLVSGEQGFGRYWYFPAPKILPVFLLGPLADGPGEALVVALVAGCLGAATSWIVARSFGVWAGLAIAVLVPLDPWWSSLVAIASGDLLLTAGIAGTVVAWTVRRERLAAALVMLATLVKPPAAAAIAPLLLERGRGFRARFGLVLAAAAGFGLTALGYTVLLGGPGIPLGFLTAYTALRGVPVPAPHAWLGRWLAEDLATELLPWSWPLAAVGLVATLVLREARPMRRWLATSVAVGAAYVLLSVRTETVLFARFLWSLELCTLALCAVGAVTLGRGIAALIRTPVLDVAVRAVATGLLLVMTAAGLMRSAAGAGGRYMLLFEHGARTALPWIEDAAAAMAPGDRIVVPLWFQPALLWKLHGRLAASGIDAAEVLVARPAAGERHPEWLLLAPAYFENPATALWSELEASSGYDVVASSAVPNMRLLRRRGAESQRASR